MTSSQRDEWTTALQGHQREVENLSRQVAQLDAANEAGAAGAARSETVRRQIEYANAQMIRHRIRMALLTSRLTQKVS